MTGSFIKLKLVHHTTCTPCKTHGALRRVTHFDRAAEVRNSEANKRKNKEIREITVQEFNSVVCNAAMVGLHALLGYNGMIH